jgi:thiosulfate dehydrogenase [quinone] large subunit
MTGHRAAAYALLRFTLGAVLLVYGIGKFRTGIGNVAAGIVKQFSGKLPAALVQPFAYALPFAEVTLGALILVGLFTTVALVLSGLLFAALTFGMAVAGEGGIVAHNLQYALINFVLLWFSDPGGFSVDRLIMGRPSSPAG